MNRTCRHNGFSIIEMVIVAFVMIVLIGLTIPAAFRVQTQAVQMKDLNNGKQIYLGLKLFATDNDGRFPWANYDAAFGGPATTGSISNANAAYQNICPQYVQLRAIFYVANSVWTPRVPDENATTAPLTQPGENAYAYVPGLTTNSNPNFPLLADAFSSTIGVYSRTLGEKGSLWKGKSALVVRVDGATRFEPCNPKTLRIPGEADRPDIFAPGRGWIPQAPVNPL
jgi:type II secretory pathway pseudopilin PulG